MPYIGELQKTPTYLVGNHITGGGSVMKDVVIPFLPNIASNIGMNDFPEVYEVRVLRGTFQGQNWYKSPLKNHCTSHLERISLLTFITKR